MPAELATLEIKFQYLTRGVEQIEELAKVFEKLSKDATIFDTEMRKNHEAMRKIESGVSGLISSFAEPFQKWYGGIKNVMDIVKGLSEKTKKADVSNIDALQQHFKLQDKTVKTTKKQKPLQQFLHRFRLKQFGLDNKITKNTFKYGMGVMGVAGAYALWGPIPALIVGLATAFIMLAGSIGAAGMLTGKLKNVAIGTGLLLLGLNLENVVGFFQGLMGGAKQTADQTSQDFQEGLSIVQNASIESQQNVTRTVDEMLYGTSTTMEGLAKIAKLVFSVKLPEATAEGMSESSKETLKHFQNVQTYIGDGTTALSDEFRTASRYVFVYQKSLVSVGERSTITTSAVQALKDAYSTLSTMPTPTLPQVKEKESMAMKGVTRALEVGGLGWMVGGPIGGAIGGLVGAGIGMFETGRPSPLVGVAGLIPEELYEMYEKLSPEQKKLFQMIRPGVGVLQTGGLLGGGGFARVHEGENVVPSENKGVTLTMNFNLKASLPSISHSVSSSEIRELVKRVSEHQTKELYRRQTTLL